MNDSYNSNIAVLLLISLGVFLGLGIFGYAVIALAVYIASRW